MNKFSEEIASIWETCQRGYAQELPSLLDTRHPAWSVVLPDGRFGVAVPYSEEEEVYEAFANARVESLLLKNISDGSVLVLSSYESSRAFASLCAEFVSPGKNGAAREDLVSSPVSWWKEWKGLLGNRSIDRRVYDVLGEMICLEVLCGMGLDPIWNGPDGASCDIDCGTRKYEVKSTLSRSSKNVQIHGLFQLSNENEVEKHLLLVQFEPSIDGFSINGMVETLAGNGFSRAEINNSLLDLGYPQGNSARNKCYSLHGLTDYIVDNSFPHISPESFVGGMLPLGVTSINYGVALDDVPGNSLMAYVDTPYK